MNILSFNAYIESENFCLNRLKELLSDVSAARKERFVNLKQQTDLI
jgi:hypothetical protein